jgi:hypothetical protein
MHYQVRGLGLHEQGILELVHIFANPKHQGLGYSTRESKHISNTSIILGATLSNGSINIEIRRILMMKLMSILQLATS